jgi:type I restriction enzyme M protein
MQTIIDRNYDLDIKNPNKKVEEVVYDRKAIIEKLELSFEKSTQILKELKVV